MSNLLNCRRCLYDETFPAIEFDGEGVCNYCRILERMEEQYPNDSRGEAILERMVLQMKKAGQGKKYDCIVGVSGGCDSSYLLYRLVQYGLRPLAVHYDNTWNSPTATQNIFNVTSALKVPLFTHVMDNHEADDLYRAFLLSGVRELDCASDIAFVATLYRQAEKHGVKFIIEGHSFRTEGFAPLGWSYFDGKYIESVHQTFGKLKHLKTFPNMSLWQFIRWTGLRNIKRLRPLYYMKYDKEEAKAFLSSNLGWQWYGGHHLENRMAAFKHSYVTQAKGEDTRILGYAAMVRSGQMSREEGLRLLALPAEHDTSIVELVKKRLGFDDETLQTLMARPYRPYTDFATYKRSFERLRPLFWLLLRLDRIPQSFYIKYCFPRVDDSLSAPKP
ncbi:N-acetyl sugar amidotransferase [Magnetospirillum moscoviense]|uniref:LPS biosynthesis protein n=1 Tax=Magnetospirillum moscoviense TaxID=1437059 RepID=A0A178MX28_9PROT|nr:N-acetyl sugar amidotransferase [Magnetospirillum moscoviense]OAN55083.1 LPS biosynthesis protein [Magnetospirillum moscoviense]